MVSGQLHASTALPRGRKSARYPRNWRLGGPRAGWTLARTYMYTKPHCFTPQKTAAFLFIAGWGKRVISSSSSSSSSSSCDALTNFWTVPKLLLSLRSFLLSPSSSENRGIPPLVLNIATGWWVASFTPRQLYLGDERAPGTQGIGCWVGPEPAGRWLEPTCLPNRTASHPRRQQRSYSSQWETQVCYCSLCYLTVMLAVTGTAMTIPDLTLAKCLSSPSVYR